MLDSRLEKFIYAICSMDVSDLPVPLSRIEKLWNCLITGEIPDFEPLSRNEKYLMAMLDRYDISNLPAPMTRGEKLLYKIAVGETDLSDVPGYLSRYEELLKYLIENGGIGDFEYVLYTLNQSMHTLYTTAEKPVKSAILKGNTLVNLTLNTDIVFSKSNNDSNDIYTVDPSTPKKINITQMSANSYWRYISKDINLSMLKPNTKYILFATKMNGIRNVQIATGAGGNRLNTKVENITNNYAIITTNDLSELSNSTGQFLYFGINDFTEFPQTISIEDIMLIEYQDGMEKWDIPYFTGMQSVKMPVLTTTGKNLFDIEKAQDGYLGGEPYTVYPPDNNNKTSDYIEVKPNTTYTYSFNGFTSSQVNNEYWTGWFYYISPMKVSDIISVRQVIRGSSDTSKIATFTTPSDCHYIRIGSRGLSLNGAIVQLEEGSVATPYEPFKSNILTINEPIELRGIGNVQDTLNGLTGEVTQYFDEVTFDGSDDEKFIYLDVYSNNDFALFEYQNYFDFNISVLKRDGNMMCDKFRINPMYLNPTKEGVYCQYKHVNVMIEKSKLSELSPSGFRTYLNQNPIKMILPKQESIKTVDLTVVDQDNQPTKLGTFENVTHVLLESAGLIPEVAMEVATNLLEDTVFNLTEAFNTLYPTAAKPVVDGTLYGQTLVNLLKTEKNRDYVLNTDYWIVEDDYFKLVAPSVDTNYQWCTIQHRNGSMLQPNSKYLLVFDVKENSCNGTYNLVFDGYESTLSHAGQIVSFNDGEIGIKKAIVTTSTTIDVTKGLFRAPINLPNGGKLTFRVMAIPYQEGMENWDIPYFEGMQSVKMPVLKTTGKNLFDIEKLEGLSANIEMIENGIRIKNSQFDITRCFPTPFKENTQYTVSFKHTQIEGVGREGFRIYYTDGTDAYMIPKPNSSHVASSLPNKTIKSVSLSFNEIGTSELTYIQLEEGSVATPYEPFKSNILTTPSNLELRKVGEVQDELNVMTGEVVERIDEMILNGSEKWALGNSASWSEDGNTIGFYFKFTDEKTSIAYSDKLPLSSDIKTNDIDCFYINAPQKWIGIRLSKSKLSNLTIEGLKVYLKSNPITIQYQLATPTTKTVDLTVVNQDGNETKLRTFDDTTHVLLNSEGLISTAALTVRTKIPSGSSTSLLMNDISTKQEQLNTTVDEQSENVDATMVATTEIYEETL